jgi:dUTP pyrophosphatase
MTIVVITICTIIAFVIARMIVNESRKVRVRVKLLHPDAILPRRIYRGDACFDISSLEDTVIPAGESKLVKAGYALEIPEDYEIQLRPRSHQSFTTYLSHWGTIDSNFRGDIGPCLHNFSKNDYIVKRGDRVCQLAIRPAPKVSFKIVSDLTPSERGEKGFGSSGL